jgi:hypothetical protein
MMDAVEARGEMPRLVLPEKPRSDLDRRLLEALGDQTESLDTHLSAITDQAHELVSAWLCAAGILRLINPEELTPKVHA